MLFNNSVRAAAAIVNNEVLVEMEGITDVEIRISDADGLRVEGRLASLEIPAGFAYPIEVDVSVWGEPFGHTQGNHSEAHAKIESVLKDRWCFSAMRHMKDDDVVGEEGIAKGMVRAAQMLGFKAEQYGTLLGAVSYCEVEDQNEEVWKVVIWEEDEEYVNRPANYHFQNPPPTYSGEDEDEDAYLGESVFARVARENAAKAAPCVDPVAQYEKYQD